MKTQMIIGGILLGWLLAQPRQTVTGLPATLKGLVTEKPYCYNRQVSGNRRWEIR